MGLISTAMGSSDPTPQRRSDVIAAVLADYCRDAGIATASAESQDVAMLLGSLYNKGHTTSQKLKHALKRAIADEDARA